MPRDYYNPSKVNNQQRPPTTPKRRGPVHNGGTRGTYDYNVGKKPYEQQTPFERSTGRQS